MTNFDRWMDYTSDLPSPENYIRWGWLYIIGATLQRRVWLGPAHQPCYPNTYTILVGPPGVGKGLVLKEVASFLKHWPLEAFKASDKMTKNPENTALVEAGVTSNLKHATEVEFQGSNKGPKDLIKPLLIPVCADSITCEALIKAVAEAYRYINYMEPPINGSDKPKLKAHGHSSLCFVLPELSSLMKKNTQNTNNFLLSIYDCPIDHEYISISRGKDRIRRGCLNIIAGTTPSFMQSTFDEDLIGEGFSSRTFYIFAPKNRKHMCWLPALTSEQEAHKKILLDHIKKLTSIYGQARISPSTEAWMQNWWCTYCEDTLHKNKSPEMVPYYARKQIHVFKVAMAMHFSEDAETDEYGRPANEIPLETFQAAIKFLGLEERNMHLALVLEGKHPGSKISRKVLELLMSGKKNYADLYSLCYRLGDRKTFEEALEFLTLTSQINSELVMDKVTNKEMIYWSKV